MRAWRRADYSGTAPPGPGGIQGTVRVGKNRASCFVLFVLEECRSPEILGSSGQRRRGEHELRIGSVSGAARGLSGVFLGAACAAAPGARAAAGGTGARPAFFSAEDLEGAKARAGRYPWGARALQSIIAAADRWRAHPHPLPEGPTGNYHDYFCPEHGVALRHDPDRPQEHVCPVDNKVHRGPKLDAYWVTATVRDQVQAAVQCALAFRLTGNEGYRSAASEVLLRSAAHYRDRIAATSPRRWMWQSLDEAVYVLDAVRVFELLAGAGSLSAEETRLVAEGYLLPTARFLLGERKTINNINSWYNSAIL